MRSSPPAPRAVVADMSDGVLFRLRRIGPGSDLPPTAVMLRLLDGVERARAARIENPAHSASFVAGRYLLRLLVTDLLHVPAGLLASSSVCPGCGPEGVPDHGRPGYLLDGEPVPLALSLSRAGGFVLLAALDLRGSGAAVHPPRNADPAAPTDRESGPAARPMLGIDLASVAAVDFDGFDGMALTPDESVAVGRLAARDRGVARARLWARKEALVKAMGTGFTDRDPDAVEVLRDGRLTDLHSIDDALLEPLGLVAAVAVVG